MLQKAKERGAGEGRGWDVAPAPEGALDSAPQHTPILSLSLMTSGGSLWSLPGSRATPVPLGTSSGAAWAQHRDTARGTGGTSVHGLTARHTRLSLQAQTPSPSRSSSVSGGSGEDSKAAAPVQDPSVWAEGRGVGAQGALACRKLNPRYPPNAGWRRVVESVEGNGAHWGKKPEFKP